METVQCNELFLYHLYEPLICLFFFLPKLTLRSQFTLASFLPKHNVVLGNTSNLPDILMAQRAL